MYYGYSYGLNHVSRGAAVDADAQAFITAASITDATQQSAVNQLVLDLKAASIWTKMKAVYPFVGGSASTHKWNLKDPRDLDAAYRLVFSGGLTHSSNGVLFGGVNGWGNSKMLADVLTNNSTHLSFYSRNNEATGQGDMGASNASGTSRFTSGFYGATIYFDQYDVSSGGRSSNTPINTQGLFTMSRTSSNLGKGYRNSSVISTNNNSITSVLPSVEIGVGLQNGVGLYSTHQFAFASIGDGLNDTEVSNLYTAVQTFQTTLSRNV